MTVQRTFDTATKTQRRCDSLICTFNTKPNSTMFSSKSLHPVKLSFMYLALVVVFMLGAVLKRFLCLRSYIVDAFDAIAGEKLPPEFYWDSLFGAKMFGHVWHSVEVDVKKRARLGDKAINSPVISLQDGKYHHLLDFAQNKRPLVVNFGSCTCPVFMKRMDKYAQVIAEFKHIADFVTVYIEEAHPQDGWAFENNKVISSHKTQDERVEIARLLSTHNASCCPVLVDTILDAANIAYGAFPIRLYIIKDNHVVYQGGSGPFGYKLEEISDWLTQNSRDN